MQPQTWHSMNLRMFDTIEDLLQVADAMKIDVILVGTSVRDVSANCDKLKVLVRGVEFQEEWFVVLFVGTRNQIEAAADKRARKFRKRPRFERDGRQTHPVVERDQFWPIWQMRSRLSR